MPLLLAGCGHLWSARGQDDPPTPPGPLFYTATGAVKALAVGQDGRLWAATSGGVLRWTGTAVPQRWTVAEGLDSNDVRTVAIDGGSVLVTTAVGQDHIDKNGAVTRQATAVGVARTASDGQQTWRMTSDGVLRQSDGRCLGWPDGRNIATIGNVTGLAANAQGVFLATSLGVWRWTDGRWYAISLPRNSPASHVSALTSAPSGLLAGLYGDGVYRWTAAGQWLRLPAQPPGCQFPAALVSTADSLAVGTRDGGVWKEQNGHWQAYPVPPALPSADINSLAAFHGSLWASTFDAGLLRLTGTTAQAMTSADGLRSNSPRDLAVFNGSLYVRHADGLLDSSSDGVAWKLAFSKSELPRQEVYALAAGRRLLLGGWAGWAATDGHTWERHYHDPELQGQVITAIAAQDDKVWIGTQKRGLLCWQGGRYTAYQEPQGLTDDWITCLAVRGDRVLVGTYTGGLLEKQDDLFVVRLKPGTFAVRAIAFDPNDGAALAATPLGIYREQTPGRWSRLNHSGNSGLETQAMLPGAGGVWAATRTGLAFIPRRLDRL